MLVGYARVSTNHQETHLQMDALKRAGCRRIYREKASSVGQRPQLDLCLSGLQPGQVLTVYKLDRVARSLRELLQVLEALHARGVGFRSLTEPIDTSTPVGLLILQILGAVAQFERSLIRQRALAGQVAAYRRGVRWGGQKRVLTEVDRVEVQLLRRTGLFTIAMLSDIFGCSQSTICRAIGQLKRKPLPVLGAMISD